jgi:hypothetical protein
MVIAGAVGGVYNAWSGSFDTILPHSIISTDQCGILGLVSTAAYCFERWLCGCWSCDGPHAALQTTLQAPAAALAPSLGSTFHLVHTIFAHSGLKPNFASCLICNVSHCDRAMWLLSGCNQLDLHDGRRAYLSRHGVRGASAGVVSLFITNHNE